MSAQARIEIYVTTYCPYCVRAKELLKRKGATFTEIDVTGDDAARMALVERSEGRRTVPQIFIDGRGIGGCDDLYALDRAGELDQLLKG
ncbi:MAG: glutaredoxin 3 [Rhodospirillales bacterium]|nr:glutaredoxin 3 [Alphaproteobacteria bacterium]MCB9987674.1 glutaredoxin 3 [Rhodospirillales bacterium]USO08025.1 MAG: glutaredoxin 3 [Rhodospirillales bacterium]